MLVNLLNHSTNNLINKYDFIVPILVGIMIITLEEIGLFSRHYIYNYLFN